ncbi:DUF4747 family protein [Sphingobacterium lactis]|uniref:DUF4747 family protein n=1 Tax=Sphingobacterium lactis TaxID=797291 RepID=UPI003F7D23B3
MEIKLNFYIFNIKIQSKKTGDERTKEYLNIIKKLSVSKKPYPITKNEAVMMYGLLGYSEKEIPEYVYGRIARGTYIEGDEVNVLDGDKVVKKPNQKGLMMPIQADFIFIPKIHRLGLEKVVGGPSPFNVYDFLYDRLTELLDEEDILSVVLEKDEKIIEEIYNAKALFGLKYKISYTNDDLTPTFGKELDHQLKAGNVGSLIVSAKADNKDEGLNLDESVILKGGLELAERNGEIQSAQIKRPDSNQIVSISNASKPKVVDEKYDEEGNKWQQWYNIIKRII